MGSIPTWLTSREAGDRLGLDESYVRRLCAKGELKAIRKGYTWLIDPESVEQWQRQREKRHETD